jgi:3'-5' exoribonuclease
METFNTGSKREPTKAMISELKPGQRITAFFVLRKKELRTKRDSSDLYLSLELGDASGRIWGSLWQKVEESYKTIEEGKPVKVLAVAIDYKGKLHLNIEKVRPVMPKDHVTSEQFLPVCSKDPEFLYAQLLEKIKGIKNKAIQELLSSFFNDSEFKKEFSRAPGGKLWHHAYIGGLLEHTLAVAHIAETIAGLYPEIKIDILLAGALLHDIGKIREYRTVGLIDFSDEGRLHGHISIGHNMVAERIQTISGFPKELRDELLHLILSHQGSKENGSPIPPMTLEAMILYYADELDSKANALQRIIHKEKSGKHWSSYVPLLDRFIYLGSEHKTVS